MSSTVEPYAESWLEIEKAIGTRPIITGTIEEIKAGFAMTMAMTASIAPPPDPTVTTRDTTADHVALRVYTPLDSPPGNKKLPLGVYYHAGGYAVGDLDTDDALCRHVSKTVPCVIVSVGYRLAPEFKHPTMLEDSLVGFHWAYENAAIIGGDAEKVFTVGASAGGGLALTVANTIIKSGQRSKVHGIVALSPVTAHPSSLPEAYAPYYTSHEENGVGVPIIDKVAIDTYVSASGADPHDECVFITLSQDLDKFPRTYLVSCGKDPLRDDAKVLERMFREKGVSVKNDYYAGLPHCFWLIPEVKETDAMFENLTAGVKWALE